MKHAFYYVLHTIFSGKCKRNVVLCGDTYKCSKCGSVLGFVDIDGDSHMFF